MIVQPLQLRHALAQHLGCVLTPEACAWVEAVAVANPMPVPVQGDQAMGVRVDQDQRFFDFINDRLPVAYDPTTSRVIAHVRGESILAVIVFTNPGVHSVEMAVASDGGGHWLSRAFLHCLFAFPFMQLGLERVTGIVRGDNEAALRLNQHLGFKVEGASRREFGDVDGILMGMLRTECKWLKESSNG